MAKKKDAIDIAAQQRAREQAEVEQAFLTGVRTIDRKSTRRTPVTDQSRMPSSA